MPPPAFSYTAASIAHSVLQALWLTQLTWACA